MKKITLILLSLLLVLSLASCKNPPAPQIKEAEFDFQLVYELNGEAMTISGVYVCKYDGLGWNELLGKYREWDGYIKGTDENTLVLHEVSETLKITCFMPPADILMGETPDAEEFYPAFYLTQYYPEGGVSSSGLDSEELLEEYNIKIISWQMDAPIENTFE